MIDKLEQATIKFKNAREMYDSIHDGFDLYDLTAGIYLFDYNEIGAICSYNLSRDEMISYAEKAKQTGEYISGLLGPGGSIYDMNLRSPDGEVIEYGDPEFDEAYGDDAYMLDDSEIIKYLETLVPHEFIQLSHGYD